MNRKGQALIEVAVFMLFLGGFMAGLVVFTQWIQCRQKVLLAAKQGALLYSSGRFEKSHVEQHMRRYLISGPPYIQPDQVKIEIKREMTLIGINSQLDRITVHYQPPAGGPRWLGPLGEIRESCVVRHAPTYAYPYQPFYGPAVSWWD